MARRQNTPQPAIPHTNDEHAATQPPQVATRADRDRLRRMVEEALPAAKARAEQMGELKAALIEGDDDRALAIARQLCGLSENDHA